MVVGAVEQQRGDLDATIEDGSLGSDSSESELVHRPSRPQSGLVGERLGHEVDVGIGERAR